MKKVLLLFLIAFGIVNCNETKVITYIFPEIEGWYVVLYNFQKSDSISMLEGDYVDFSTSNGDLLLSQSKRPDRVIPSFKIRSNGKLIESYFENSTRNTDWSIAVYQPLNYHPCPGMRSIDQRQELLLIYLKKTMVEHQSIRPNSEIKMKELRPILKKLAGCGS